MRQALHYKYIHNNGKQNHSEIQYQTDFNVQEVNENVEIKNDSIA